MGVEIVKAAMVYGKSLSGNGYKVLVAMSMSALDKPSNGRPPGLYWGGWDALAIALGYEHAERNSPGQNAVARAVRELKKGNHITPMLDAGRGTRQSYLVHPGGIRNGGKGEQNAHAEGEQFAQPKGEQNAPQRVSKMLPPRKEQGSTSDLSQDTTPHEAASTTGSDVAESERAEKKPGVGSHAHRGGVDDDCAECGLSYQNRAHFRRGLRAI
ncbi:hypothetical protein J2X46_002717 [Nocardioides sp. BE266]|uniref:hypothetical protein n=1 Tax=Nocardioides sp. BE266 TaxID=2817725 RepID=UPI00285D1FD4|nr:hypothetical protein [Nocardioides sp. BE266]MDR7253727.1 hypothetical protein [Nocardioides sp. BE266]